MSRSRNKSTFVLDNSGRGNRKRFFKKYFNKSLRNRLNMEDNEDDLLRNSIYKKYQDSYNIRDYKWYWSEKDAIREYELADEDSYIKKKFPTLKAWLRYYRKVVVYK